MERFIHSAVKNGPIHINADYSASPNPYGFNKLADYFWIDQPVGTGYATADATGYVADEDQIGKDFMGFLGNLVKVFPSLATRPLYLTGESYAGQYIPYILKAYFDMPKPPVSIAKIAIGDGTYSSEPIFELLPALSMLETYPQLIGYDQDVYNYFKAQTSFCGFDVNLTYPQNGIIPDNNFIQPTLRDIPFFKQMRYNTKKTFLMELTRRGEEQAKTLAKRDVPAEKAAWKRDLSLRTNGTVDPWYGCFLLDMAIDYAVNFTFPWSEAFSFKMLDILSNQNTLDLTDQAGFPINVYDIPDALNPKVNRDASVFMNDPRTRAALHAPTSTDWEAQSDFPFGLSQEDPSPMSINIFNALAVNATARGVGVVLFSGNDDMLIPHRGTEIAIQNTTFGGIQGFTRKPSTPWKNDKGEFGGVVHQERGWTYGLLYASGHLFGQSNPVSAFTFLREFILGNNPTGLVKSQGGSVTVVGGEVQSLAGVLQGGDNIYYGNGATQSTYVFPAATRAAWKTFIQGNQATPTHISTQAPRTTSRIHPPVLQTRTSRKRRTK
ncbi:Carboxypeptidase Y-like protein [Psilocybe cubensis]|uniref:Carboxypeptidase Y-like protein n=2 Tax=Psilocybe cubensis TaxID=181762 RepID=A0ACB8GVP8_PSICU|nr:Carboxypeptidase Y-like protein [Psilocybe cubensis]KAH9479549.1 Carboxypeptidase Y-like protein [Psilocybe cubensis]